jgi:hypothetical protein
MTPLMQNIIVAVVSMVIGAALWEGVKELWKKLRPSPIFSPIGVNKLRAMAQELGDNKYKIALTGELICERNKTNVTDFVYLLGNTREQIPGRGREFLAKGNLRNDGDIVMFDHRFIINTSPPRKFKIEIITNHGKEQFSLRTEKAKEDFNPY